MEIRMLKSCVRILQVLLLCCSVRAQYSLGSECDDRSVCKNFFDCSDSDAIRRAGHTCSVFPWYQGGAPLLKFAWDREWETYLCTRRVNSTCMQWSIEEISNDERETGTGQCLERAIPGDYCRFWRVDQTETGTAENNRNGLGVDTEFTSCECTGTTPPDDKGNQACSTWVCNEVDGEGFTRGEVEHYTCHRFSENHGFCLEWTGEIDGSKEFELALCKCNLPHDDHCSSWNCEERGMHYYHPDLRWSAFGTFMMGIGFVLLFGVCIAPKPKPVHVFVAVGGAWLVTAFLGGMIFVTLSRGGFLSVFISIICDMVFFCITGICIKCWLPVKEDVVEAWPPEEPEDPEPNAPDAEY